MTPNMLLAANLIDNLNNAYLDTFPHKTDKKNPFWFSKNEKQIRLQTLYFESSSIGKEIKKDNSNLHQFYCELFSLINYGTNLEDLEKPENQYLKKLFSFGLKKLSTTIRISCEERLSLDSSNKLQDVFFFNDNVFKYSLYETLLKDTMYDNHMTKAFYDVLDIYTQNVSILKKTLWKLNNIKFKPLNLKNNRNSFDNIETITDELISFASNYQLGNVYSHKILDEQITNLLTLSFHLSDKVKNIDTSFIKKSLKNNIIEDDKLSKFKCNLFLICSSPIDEEILFRSFPFTSEDTKTEDINQTKNISRELFEETLNSFSYYKNSLKSDPLYINSLYSFNEYQKSIEEFIQTSATLSSKFVLFPQIVRSTELKNSLLNNEKTTQKKINKI